MRSPELFFVTAVMLLVASVALIIVGAVLQYLYGPGLGAPLFQTGRILLVGGGAVTIWHFKWNRGSKRIGTRTKRSPMLTLGIYAFSIAIAVALFAIVVLQRQGRYFVADDRLLNFVLAVFPLLMAALVVAYFLVRYSAGKPPGKKSRRPK